MSILIEGMEMPKNCYGCPFFKQVDYWNKNDEADILSKCKRTGEFTWESVNGYLPNCPLVPVPPHGRCIDADALMSVIAKNMKEAKQADNYDWWNACSVAGDFLMDAPTIIPAEEGE